MRDPAVGLIYYRISAIFVETNSCNTMKKRFLPALLIGIVPSLLLAQQPWELLKGPANYDPSSIQVVDGKLYAGVNRGGLFVTVDNGTNWEKFANIPEENITQVSKVNNKLVVTLYNDYPMFSEDNGLNWTKIGKDYNMRTVTSFVNKGDTLFMVNTNGLFITSNYGATYQHIVFDSLSATSATKIFRQKDTLYIGSYGGTIRSVDLGKTWHKLNLPGVTGVLHVNGKIFASHGSGVSLSTDGGKSWVAKNNGLNTNVTRLGYYNNKLYAATYSELYYSNSLGNSWLPMTTGIESDGYSLFVSSFTFHNNALYVGLANRGFYKTTDNGSSWTFMDGIYASDIRSIVAFGDTVVTGDMHGALFISTNLGKTFSKLGTVGGTVQSLVYDPNTHLVYAPSYSLAIFDPKTKTQLYPTTFSNFTEGISDMAFYKDTLYLLTESKIYKAKSGFGPFTQIYDHSATKERMSKFAFVNGTIIIGSNNATNMFYYANLTPGTLVFAKSAPVSGSGATSDYNPRAFSVSNNRVYAATVHGLFKSDDFGKTWKRINLVNYIQTVTAKDDYVFAGSLFNNNYYSVDKGDSWDVANENFATKYFNVSTYTNGYLFGGSAAAGLWRMPIDPVITHAETTTTVVNEHQMAYPNPAVDQVQLRAKEGSAYSISDMAGNRLLAGSVVENAAVDITSLQPGVYVVQVAGQTSKLVKQ